MFFVVVFLWAPPLLEHSMQCAERDVLPSWMGMQSWITSASQEASRLGPHRTMGLIQSIQMCQIVQQGCTMVT